MEGQKDTCDRNDVFCKEYEIKIVVVRDFCRFMLFCLMIIAILKGYTYVYIYVCVCVRLICMYL